MARGNPGSTLGSASVYYFGTYTPSLGKPNLTTGVRSFPQHVTTSPAYEMMNDSLVRSRN